jgi:hypothetical protein
LPFVSLNPWLGLVLSNRNEPDGIMIWLLRHNQQLMPVRPARRQDYRMRRNRDRWRSRRRVRFQETAMPISTADMLKGFGCRQAYESL